jgi:nucleoside-diphosphate-sugar epimerase
MTSEPILVLGATGRQGGAVARELLKRGRQVWAFTRSPASQAAQALAEHGARPVEGDLDDPASIRDPDKPLQMVATADIGVLAADAFQRPDHHIGTAIALAGPQIAVVFGDVTGRRPACSGSRWRRSARSARTWR